VKEREKNKGKRGSFPSMGYKKGLDPTCPTEWSPPESSAQWGKVVGLNPHVNQSKALWSVDKGAFSQHAVAQLWKFQKKVRVCGP